MAEETSLPLPSPATTGDPTGIVQQVDDALPSGWRLKLAKAAAQLFAGTAAGSRVYGDIRERLDTIEGRSAVSKALANAVAQQAVGDPETMERAKARFLGSILQKQENIEAVVLGAEEEVRLLPSPPASITEDALSSEDVGDEETSYERDQPLDSDWAATFSDIAENATSAGLRQRLSRILAGELTSPGTYSRAIVRQIAELEKVDLEAMQAVLPFVLQNEILTFGSPSNPSVEMLLPLAEAGLVMDSSYTLSKTWPPAAKDNAEMLLPGKKRALVFYMKAGQVLSFQVVRLTRMGSAVADLLGGTDEDAVLRRLAEVISEGSYNSVRIGDVVPGGASGLTQILPAPPAYTISGVRGLAPFGAPLITP